MHTNRYTYCPICFLIVYRGEIRCPSCGEWLSPSMWKIAFLFGALILAIGASFLLGALP